MKKIVLFICFVFSFNLFSQSMDYRCNVRNYTIDLNLRNDTSTHIWLYDNMYREVIAQAYAGAVQREGSNNVYLFYPGNAAPIKLVLKTKVATSFPDRFAAYIETRARGFLLWENINCFKN